MRTRDLTDEEVLELGYRVLMEKLGPAGFVRFARLHESPKGDYAEIRDKIFDGMTVEEIYEEAIRLESEREGKQDSKG